MKPSLSVMLVLAGVCFAAEPVDRSGLIIPEGAVKIEAAKISYPLAHKARKAGLLFEKLAGGRDFCEIPFEQAADLAGAQYENKAGLKPILVKWTYVEPVNQKGLDLVFAHDPEIHIKDDVLYVSSSGIDIGDVAKRVEGYVIVQLAAVPNQVVGKMDKTGW